MDDPAYGVLRGKLAKIKRSNVDPAWLGKELLAAEIVDIGDAERAKNAEVGVDVRLADLIEKVLGNGDPDVFRMLVEILFRKPHIKWLAKELKGMPSDIFLASYSSYTF